MRPITFNCEEILPKPPEEIGQLILDVTMWPSFRGYGPIPGIKAAAFEVQTPSIVGSRIRVTNQDGSSHVEEIVQWQPDKCIQLLMKEFSPPLSRFATRFEETWQFNKLEGTTRVIRSFELFGKSVLAWLPLKLISFFLKRAIARHLRDMRTR